MRRFVRIKQSLSNQNTWSYEQFKSYLLLLLGDQNALLPLAEYPNRIRLNGDWTSVLDRIRTDSQDGLERFALIGYRTDRQSLFLQTVPSTGLSHKVPVEVVKQTIQRARNVAGIVDILGSIHSHPKRILERKSFWGLMTEKVPHKAVFSAEDLYEMILPEKFFPIKVLVEGNDNLIAFRSRESQVLQLPSNTFSQKAFAKYWYQEVGHGWQVNLKIAERHKLALYQGSPDNLQRVIPPQVQGAHS